jgi:hypothetical protein
MLQAHLDVARSLAPFLEEKGDSGDQLKRPI